MLRISHLAHKFRVKTKRKKKSSLARSLRLSLGVHSRFSSWNKTLITPGRAQAVFWVAQAPKCTPVAPGLSFSLGAQSSLEGHTSLLGSTNSDLGEHGPETPGVEITVLANFGSFLHYTVSPLRLDTCIHSNDNINPNQGIHTSTADEDQKSVGPIN